MPTRTLLIGMDAMDGTLLRQWADAGLLPNLGAALKNTQWARTENAPGFYASVSIWPSFYTGSTPADHGRYAFRQFLPGSYESEETHPENISLAPFWESLSQAGKRLALLDLPSAPLYPQLNGVQLAYWGPHDIEGACCSVPADYAADVRTQYGDEPVGQCDYGGRGPADITQFRDALVTRVRRRLAFSLDCLERENWDLFAMAFSESHCVGHQAWHLHDPDHPAHDRTLAGKSGDPILAVYQAIDHAVGEVLRAAGTGSRLMIFSSQGMGPAYSGDHLLARILSQRGVATNPDSLSGKLYRGLIHLRSVVPPALHAPFTHLKNRLRNRLLANDWAGRDCFQVPASNHGVSCLRFNLVGREPQGKLHAGAELEQFYSALRVDLEALVEPGTDRHLVKQVLRTDTLFSGPQRESFPDILVEWNNERPIHAAWSAATGLVEGVQASRRSGDHTPQGFVMVGGSGSGELDRAVPVADLAPTLLHWLGVTASQCTGTPVRQWL